MYVQHHGGDASAALNASVRQGFHDEEHDGGVGHGAQQMCAHATVQAAPALFTHNHTQRLCDRVVPARHAITSSKRSITSSHRASASGDKSTLPPRQAAFSRQPHHGHTTTTPTTCKGNGKQPPHGSAGPPRHTHAPPMHNRCSAHFWAST